MAKKWPDELIAKLGRIPDADLAALAGVSVQAVYQRRKKMGIAAQKWKSGNTRVSDLELSALLSRVRKIIEWNAGQNQSTGGASQRGLADAVGVDGRTLRRWLSGDRQPAAAKLDAIRSWLHHHDPGEEVLPDRDDLHR